jgi:hypothetical protein
MVDLFTIFSGFLIDLLFDPEDRSDIFLQNVVISPNYGMVLKPRKLYSSHSEEFLMYFHVLEWL